MRVGLVVMPFASADRPSLGAGLLQAALHRRGIECDTKHFNVTLCRMMGAADFHHLARDVSVAALVGEWAFSQAYFGERLSTWESYQREVLDVPLWGMSARDRPRVLALRELAPLFLRLVFESNDWGAYDLVGFTSTFEQTMPGLCLARMIRERYPRVKIAFGGANFEAGMGRPYMEHFDFIDYVSTGEADLSFPALCERLRDGNAEVPAGFLYRDAGGIAESPRIAGTSPRVMDDLPTPDYSDYFRVAGATLSGEPLTPWLPVEASRGCWWGEIKHCTFCGLNGETMAFRAKSAARVLAETDALAARHGSYPLQFADNILSMSYFGDLLPAWIARGDAVYKFFEIKSNLKRQHVRLLREAGVRCVQAGVESLSDATLRVMGKGVSGAQNLAALRWCQEYGVEGLWNLLFGFPGEDPLDYERILTLLHKIVHMAPPSAVAPIRMDRFSPNFERFREHGFTSVEPVPAYGHVFPMKPEAIGRLAYYFRYQHPGYGEALERGAPLAVFVQRWEAERARGTAGELSVKARAGGGYVLSDTRFTRAGGSRAISPAELAVLLACDGPTGRRAALATAAAHSGLSKAALASALDGLLEGDVIAEVGAHLVTLAFLPIERPDVRPVGLSLEVIA